MVFGSIYNAYGQFVGYLIRNDNSGMCITQDGNPGDGAVQEPCDPDSFDDIWDWNRLAPADNNFQSRLAPDYLDLDVSGYSYNEGAERTGPPAPRSDPTVPPAAASSANTASRLATRPRRKYPL